MKQFERFEKLKKIEWNRIGEIGKQTKGQYLFTKFTVSGIMPAIM